MPVPPVPPRPMPWAPRPRLPPDPTSLSDGDLSVHDTALATSCRPDDDHPRLHPPARLAARAGTPSLPPRALELQLGRLLGAPPGPVPSPPAFLSWYSRRSAGLPPTHQLPPIRLPPHSRPSPYNVEHVRPQTPVPDKNRLPIGVPRHPPDTGAGASAGAGAALLPRCDLPLGPRVNRPCSSVSTCVHSPTRPAPTGATAPCQPARTGTPGTPPRGDAPEPRPRSALGTAARPTPTALQWPPPLGRSQRTGSPGPVTAELRPALDQ
jgi:hypothetical protein